MTKFVTPRRFPIDNKVRNPRTLPYLLILPILVISFGLVLYPIVQDIYISTTDKTLGDEIGKKVNNVGLKNYEALLSNEAFINSLKVTLLYALLFVCLSVGAGLLTALLVNKRFRGRGGIRALMTAPWAFPDIATVIVFIWIFNTAFGVVNVLGTWLPFDTSGGWLTSSPLAFVSINIISMWKTFPFYSIVFLAALQSVPDDLVEAAYVDGANAFQRFRTVTLPSIRPTLYLLCVLAFIFAFRQFSMIYLTTGGGPERDTETLVLSVYNTAFKYYDYALSSAIGVTGLLITFFVALGYLTLATRAEKKAI
jgi:multiple sugar transport system permease protein